MAVTTPAPRFALPKLPRREKTTVPRSQAERLWMIGGGIVAFVLFLIGYFFFISPQRAQTNDVNSQVATAHQQNQALQHRIDLLREENTNLASYQAALAKARLALPETSGVSDFLRSLQSLGSATLTDVTGMTVGVPKDVSLVAAAQPTVAAGAPAAPAAAPTATAEAAAPTGATGLPVTPPAIFALPITATVMGSPAALDKFLDQLQTVQPRAVLITGITEGAVVSGAAPSVKVTAGKTQLQLQMVAFVAPNSPTESASLSAASN